MSPDGSRAYVANTGPDTGSDPVRGPGASNTVSVIDVAGGGVTATIDVGQAPRVISFARDGSTAYVSCRDGVFVIDVASNRVRQALPVPGVQGVAVSPDGSTVCATLPQQKAVAVLGGARPRPPARIAVGQLPWNVAFTLDGGHAYVTNANSDTVSVIDTSRRAVTATILVGHIPTGIAAEEDYVWVAHNTSGNLSVIAIASGAVTTIGIALADEPTAIALVG